MQITKRFINYPIRAITGDTTLTIADLKIVLNDTVGNSNTVTLPAGTNGLTFQFGNAAANTGAFALAPNGTDTIDGNVPGNLAASPGQEVSITFLSGVWYAV